MEVYKVYWWEHNTKNGQDSSAKVHRLLKVEAITEQPNSIDDYKITRGDLDGLNCEEIDAE